MHVLAQISDFVTVNAKAAGLDEASIYAVQLAVDEAATNIIEHAYGGSGQGDLEITCEVLDDNLRITLHDHGKPFDPEKVPTPVVNVPLEKLKSRGLGVFLIRHMMDEVHYEFSPNEGNTLVMVKRRR